jgi:DNA-binding transcriptional ArsR family regulator
MGENEEGTGSEKVLILPLSEDSKKITQLLSNEKAMKMLEILADKPMSASDVAENLDLPLTTVKYNLDGLIEADLIKVKETKWSRKGREVKIYEPVQKLIVVAPGSMKKDRSSILNMLKKYLGLVAGAVFAATGLEAITRTFGTKSMYSQEAGIAPLFAEDEATDAMSKEANMEDITPDVMEETTEAAEEMPEIEAEEMGVTEVTTDEEVMEEAVMEEAPMEEASVDDASIDYEMPDDSAVSDGLPGVDDVSPEMLASSTSNGTEAADMAREGMNTGFGNQTQPAEITQTFTDNMSAMSEPVGGIFQDSILSHVSVWFFFGCIFVITLLFVREMYNRKKNI